MLVNTPAISDKGLGSRDESARTGRVISPLSVLLFSARTQTSIGCRTTARQLERGGHVPNRALSVGFARRSNWPSAERGRRGAASHFSCIGLRAVT